MCTKTSFHEYCQITCIHWPHIRLNCGGNLRLFLSFLSAWTVEMATKYLRYIYHTYLWKVKLWFYISASYTNKTRDSIQGHEPPHSHIHAEAVTCEELLRWKFCESANLHMRARACCLWTWLLWLAICCNKRQVSPFWFLLLNVGNRQTQQYFTLRPHLARQLPASHLGTGHTTTSPPTKCTDTRTTNLHINAMAWCRWNDLACWRTTRQWKEKQIFIIWNFKICKHTQSSWKRIYFITFTHREPDTRLYEQEGIFSKISCMNHS